MKRVLALVCINALVLVVLVMLIDPFFRLKGVPVARRHVTLREIPPLTDRPYTPSAEYTAAAEGLVRKPYRVRTDRHGYLTGPDDTAGSRPVDIIFFGGSTTECLYLDEEKRFPYLVGRMLVHAGTGTPVRTLNGGVSGNHSMHSVVNLLAKGIPLKPKIAVWMHNINDLVLLSHTGSYWKAPRSRALVKSTRPGARRGFGWRALHFLRSARDFIMPNIYMRLRSHFPVFSRVHDGGSDEWAAYRDKKTYGYGVIEKQFRSSMETFIATARAFGIEPVLMTQLNRLEPSYVKEKSRRDSYNRYMDFGKFCDYYHRLNGMIREVAATDSVLLIDLDSLLPDSKPCLYDPVHLNARGSGKVAGLIVNALLAEHPEYRRR